MKRCTRRMLCLFSLLLWLSHPAVAAETAPAPVSTPAKTEAAAEADNDADLRDPAALTELKRATDFLTALPRFHFKVAAIYDVIQEDGRSLQFEKHGDVYLQRPDQVFAETYFDDGRHRQFWYDGKTISFAERSKNLHTSVKALPTIDGTLDMMEGLFNDPMPLSDLLYSDLTPLAERALQADIVGDSLVNERPCSHLAFRGETVDWQLWIEQGITPFIRKVAITYREIPGMPQYVAVLPLWETPEKFSDRLFTFTAPAGSQWIDVLVPISKNSGSGGQP